MHAQRVSFDWEVIRTFVCLVEEHPIVEQILLGRKVFGTKGSSAISSSASLASSESEICSRFSEPGRLRTLSMNDILDSFLLQGLVLLGCICSYHALIF
jgi:hypothetical protein